MHFSYHAVDSLPPLAWCSRLEAGDPAVAVFHGKAVETRPGSFFEGAWDGEFPSSCFTEATVFAGSGGTVRGDSVRFCGSTDRLSPVFSVVRGGTVFVSNSAVFAVSAAGAAPDDAYPFYNYDFIRIWRRGLACLDGRLRLRGGSELSVHFSAVVSVTRKGRISWAAHPPGPAPTDFRSYHSLLLEGVRRVARNARDPARRQPYLPIAAISRGYDSSATAALASLAGCKEAVTFIDSREGDVRADSGAENAALLGMRCLEHDRWEYLRRDGQAEAEMGIFAISNAAPLAGLDDVLAGRLFITGHFGDTIWGLEKSAVCHNLSQTWAGFLSGVSQMEYRLRVGYLLLAPATIGARHNRAIHRIAASEEMRPWRIGGRYDRPLARRIAEEAGLPREAFGRKKMASSQVYFTGPERFSPAALRSYLSAIRTRHAALPRRTYGAWWILARCHCLLLRLLGGIRGRRIVAPSPWQERLPFVFNAAPRLIPWTYMFTLQWAFESLRGRYRLPGGIGTR